MNPVMAFRNCSLWKYFVPDNGDVDMIVDIINFDRRTW